jgi:O-antigen/teichoic acid export membrane protein
MGIFNLLTAAGQFAGWKKFASSQVGFLVGLIDRQTIWRLFKYGGVLSIWTVANLFISGLDMVIVGHYDYKDTGYYGIATGVTNFMLLVVGSAFGSLLPAVSSLQATRTPSEIGDIVTKTTRYCALLVCLIGLPLFFGGYPVLKLWVGQQYATRSVLFLEVLVLGNAIRQFGYPYALIVVATGKQHLATMSGVVEAVVNLGVSIYLVQRIGAVGVAIGTLVGAFISLGVHITVSMTLTRSTIAISRRAFVFDGIIRPLSCVIPSLFLLPFWRRMDMVPANPLGGVFWALTTIGIVWFIGITWNEREQLKLAICRIVGWDQVSAESR